MRSLTNFLRKSYARLRARLNYETRPESSQDIPPSAGSISDAARFERARELHQRGQLQEAEVIYRALLEKYPRDHDLLHFLGLALGQRGEFTSAVEFIQKAMEINPGNNAARRSYGNVLLGLGKLEEALASYDLALASGPHDADTLCNRGAALRNLGRLHDACESYQRALALNGNLLFALDNLGLILRELHRPEDALVMYDKAILVHPENAAAHYNRGMALTDLKRESEARASFYKALTLAPDGTTLNGLGVALSNLGQYQDALACYDRALTFNADDPVVHSNRGAALAGLKRHEEALACYEQVLLIQPASLEALLNSGTMLRELKRNAAALDAFDNVLSLDPHHSIAHYNRGVVLGDMGRYEEALACYDESLALEPNDPDTHCNRGVMLNTLNRYEEALVSFQRALRLQEKSVPALVGMGAAHRQLDRHRDALMAFERALAIAPNNAVVYYSCGVSLGDLRQYEAALARYDEALALEPNHVDAHNNRGVILGKLRRYEEALSSFGRALAIDSEHRPALFGRGYLLAYLRRTELAIADFEKLALLQPDYGFAISHLLHAKMSCCDWRGLQAIASEVINGNLQGKKLAEPFSCLAISTSAEFQKRSAEIYTAERFPRTTPTSLAIERRRSDKIRLGYVAGEFRHHATAFLTVELFERHDARRFELFAFDNGWDDKSDVRKRLNGCFREIVDISRASDSEAAARIRAMNIDILVDLNGHVGLGRTGIFSYRPAPVQVNWLGFPGTIGADYIDYIVGDERVIPPGQDAHYTEKVVRLPDTYQVNDSSRVISRQIPTRADVNLPESAFVFCCFNNSYKITPELFGIWMNLLNRVEQSRLWLLEDNPLAPRNLRAEAQSRGIAPERLVFAPRVALSDHLARHQLADLFLDTLPCNAHTTASDALWAGLPLVTCMGPTFAGRVAGSLLHAVGLPELITENLVAYEALALKLATTPELLAHMRSKLARNRFTYPLFDSDRFRKHIESAYIMMYERWLKGESPDGFAVTAAN